MHSPLEKCHSPLGGHSLEKKGGEARREFVLTLRAEPNVDAIKSLRRALKTLLRRDGLRCTGIMEADGDRGNTHNPQANSGS
jgi:hypothetical protein